MGYRVYAGTITGVEGHPEQIRFDGATCIHNSAGDSVAGDTYPYILDAEASLSNLEIPEFKFTVPARSRSTSGTEVIENPYYNSFYINKTFISVQRDSEEVFFGCVTAIEKQFDLSKQVTCKGLEYLMSLEDHVIYSRTDNYLTLKKAGESYKVDDYPSILGWSLSQMHYLKADGSIGYFNVDYTASTIDYLLGKTVDTTGSGDQVDTKWNTLKNLVLDEYDGYFRLYRVPVSGSSYSFDTRICCYYSAEPMGTTTQSIEYGVNLLDATVEMSLSTDYVTRVAAHAQDVETTTKGWWIFKKVTSTTVNRTAVAKDEDAEKQYGMSYKVVFSDDKLSQEKLQELADKTLKEYKQTPEEALNVKAFDLVDAGNETDRLGFLKKTPIKSTPHGIDGSYVCTQEELYIDQPDQSVFTYGLPSKKLTEQLRAMQASQKSDRLGLDGVIRYLNG